MDMLAMISQIIVILGILNVWLVRPNTPSKYRGLDARTLKEEFKQYGYPNWVFFVIGALKIASALLLAMGFLWPIFTMLGSLSLTVLMIGAVGSHLKVNDPLMKMTPALVMATLSLFIFYITIRPTLSF